MSIIALLGITVLFALPLIGTVAYVVWRNPEIRSRSQFSRAITVFVMGLFFTALCAVATVWISHRAIAGSEFVDLAFLLQLSEYFAIGTLMGICVTLGSCAYILRLPKRIGTPDRG